MDTLLSRGNVATIQLGQVWNREAGSSIAFEDTPPSTAMLPYSEVKYRVAFDLATLAESTGASARLSARVGKALKMDAMLATAEAFNVRADSVHVVVQAVRQESVRRATQDAPAHLLPAAAAHLADGTFLSEYGNFFVAAELRGAAITATIGLHGVEQEVRKSLFASMNGGFRSLGWQAAGETSLSRAMESSSRRGSISIDVFGAGGAVTAPPEIAAKLAEALLVQNSAQRLEITASLLKAALAGLTGPNFDHVFAHEMVPIELKLKRGSGLADAALRSYVRIWDLVRQEKERVRDFKLRYVPYWRNLRAYADALERIEDIEHLEARVEDLEEVYELEKGFDLKEQQLSTLGTEGIEVPPWQLGRWQRPAAEIQFSGSHGGHPMSATAVKQVVAPVSSANGSRLIQIRAQSLPNLLDGDRHLNEPGARWHDVQEVDLTNFASYAEHGVAISVLASPGEADEGAALPFSFVDDGRCIQCATDGVTAAIVLKLVVRRDMIADRLMHRCDQPLSLRYRYLPE